MGTRKAILVADDEMLLRDLIRTLLHNEGYDVLAAADGQEALELSRTHEGTIDLVLTDVEMPRLDGISAYRQIDSERPDTKVLFTSGRERAELGLPEPSPFLKKPFQMNVLMTKVKAILEGPVSTKRENAEITRVADEERKKRA